MERKVGMSMIETEENLEQNKELVDFFEKQFDKINYWLSFAEAKNGALIALNVAIMAALISIFEVIPVLSALIIILLVISSIICLLSFMPDLKNSCKEKNNTSTTNLNLIYFSDIYKIESVHKYIELIRRNYFQNNNVSVDDKLIYDLANEIMINSGIAVKRYEKFKAALKIDIIALLVMIVFIIAA